MAIFYMCASKDSELKKYSTFLNSHSPPVESKTEHFLSNPITLPGRTLNSEQILFTDLEAAVDDGLAI